MTIPLPQLDPRDEEALVAQAIDDLPASLTDRNASAFAVKLLEGAGAFYGALTYQLNRWPEAVELAVLNLLGLTKKAATAASATLTFTTGAAAGDTTIPAGTEVKTGADVDAITFATDEAVLVPGAGGTAQVAATCAEAGAAGNVGAGALVFFSAPIPGIEAVTNAAASGGQDEETLAALKARAPLEVRAQNRVVTGEDAEVFAVAVEGCLRAHTEGASFYDEVAGRTVGAGAMAVGILDAGLNETNNPTLRAEVLTALEDASWPGVTFDVWQPTPRLVLVTEVEAELLTGYAAADVQASMLTALKNLLTATDITDSDGATVLYPAWSWGATLYTNELISLLDRVEGVRRIGAIKVRTSDDYGASWTAEAAMADMTPGPAGDLTDRWGLIHWGGEHTAPASGPTTFSLTVL